MPNFKAANAVIHFDEESPHMHVVGAPVAEYKVAKETEKLELLGDDIDRKEKSLADIKGSIVLQSAILDYTKYELEEKQNRADRAVKVLEQMKRFVRMFHLLAPTIEEYATVVEKGGRLDAGNSYRGILYELGKLLERFKELIKGGLC